MTISQCHCGKEFIRVSNQKYCSPPCRLSNYIPHPHPSLLHFCALCNKEFVASNKKQQFCSSRCRGISKRGPNFREPYEVCQQCKTKIDSPTRNKKFCNQCREQRKKDASQKDAERFRLEHNYHICANCNIRFYSKKKGQQRKQVMFCSSKCRKVKLNANLYKSNNFFTSPELIIAEELSKIGIPFEHNFPISSYYVDFLLPKNVIVECDIYICSNKIHSHCDHVKDKELRRTTELTQRGYTISRLNEEIIFSSSITNELINLITTYEIKQGEPVNLDLKNAYLTTKQIALLFSVSTTTVRRWIINGKFKGAFQPAHATIGIWLVPRESL